MVGLLRIRCERRYTAPEEKDAVSDFRQFDVKKEDRALAHRLTTDMRSMGWNVEVEEI
jgi:hypothetical protein